MSIRLETATNGAIQQAAWTPELYPLLFSQSHLQLQLAVRLNLNQRLASRQRFSALCSKCGL
jgi:hypothetical protein